MTDINKLCAELRAAAQALDGVAWEKTPGSSNYYIDAEGPSIIVAGSFTSDGWNIQCQPVCSDITDVKNLHFLQLTHPKNILTLLDEMEIGRKQ